jgi:LysM repeat protein
MTTNPFYVYLHTDPVTREIVYVGKGSGNRAWTIAKGQRSDAHCEWYYEYEKKGYTMDELVTIYSKSLTSEEAKELENKCIRDFNPVFNKKPGSLKMTKEMLETAKEMQDAGKTLSAISEEFGVSHTTIQRALTGKTVSVREVYENVQ